jgi:hypothetical protein
VKRALAALLARMFPGRGRHRAALPEDTVILPRVTGDGEDQADEDTRLDIPRVRPYTNPGDDCGDYPHWLP